MTTAALEEDKPQESFVDEVTVTARKVEEDVQTVPMSVQVLSAELLDDLNLTRIADLQFNVPGLLVTNLGLNGVGLTLRGVSQQSVTGSSVATHLNGVFLDSQRLAMSRAFDLERVEVLKGPQGTLYGRNATGGSINLITRPPVSSAEAAVEATFGSFATTRLQGHVNLPVADGGLRLAFVASEGDGTVHNSIDDRRFAEEDYWGVRGSLRLYPGSSARLDLVAQQVDDDGASADLWGPNPAFLLDPDDIRLTTVTLADPHLIVENDILTANLEVYIGNLTLRSVSGYAREEASNLDDCAGLPRLQGCVRGVDPASSSQWSQEVQLVLPGSGRVGGLLGASYLEVDEASRFHNLIPLVNPLPVIDRHSTSEDSARAVFGQVTMRPSPGWRITAGLRLSSDRQRATSIGTGAEDSPTLLSEAGEWEDTSWRLEANYTPYDRLMIYAGVATGYRAGGLLPTTVSGQLDRFEPENLVAYEVGARSEWLDSRLTVNAAIFYYDFTDLQVGTVTDRGVFEVDNAASAVLNGTDVEVVFRVSDRWAVSSGVVWQPKREFVRFAHAADDPLTGNVLVRAPEWSWTTAASLSQEFAGHGAFSARLERNYRSDLFFTKENDPLFAQEGFGLLNLLLRWQPEGRDWYLFGSGRNLTDEDYFHQVFVQSSPGYPDTYEAGVGYRF